MSPRGKPLVPRIPKPREADVERAVIAVYASAGYVVYRLSQGFRAEPGGTRQTPGLPDLICLDPRGGPPIAHESKTPHGYRDHQTLAAAPKPPTGGRVKDWTRAQAQKRWRDLWTAAGLPYAIGGADAARVLVAQLEQARAA